MPQVSEIYSEELGRYRFNRDGYKLIIDPLDGTKNYNMGISYYSCAIAVLDSANQLVAGYIINLSRGHVFYAVKGKGAYHLGKPIASGKYKSLQDCDGIFVGLSKEPAQIEVLNHFMARMNSYRALGCASLDICIVAKGKAGVFVDLSNTAKIVDVLASSIILEESGGTITDLEGIPITSYCCQSEDLERIVFNKKFCTVAAADKELHNLLLHSASNLVYNH
ncbi:Inositol-1-monophosphatase [compost metagenome]